MDQNKTDLAMQFVLKGKPVQAESNLDIDPNDTMMKEFSKNTTYDDYTNFFEVTNFEMGISLKEDEQTSSTLNPQARLQTQQAKAPSGGAFASWRSATPEQAKSILYPLEFDKFSFERVIDSASPIFFNCCCMSTEFDSAVLVKRISQGDSSGVARPAVGYLRIAFTSVLIIGVNWDDGDVVKERCEFICKKMEIRYRQQDISGSVGPGAEMSAAWPTPRSLDILNKSGRT